MIAPASVVSATTLLSAGTRADGTAADTGSLHPSLRGGPVAVKTTVVVRR